MPALHSRFLFIEQVKEKKESNAGGLLDAVGRRTRRSNTLKDAVKTLGLGGGLFLNWKPSTILTISGISSRCSIFQVQFETVENFGKLENKYAGKSVNTWRVQVQFRAPYFIET